MEDPAHKLPIDDDLRIVGDKYDMINTVKKSICESILMEDRMI